MSYFLLNIVLAFAWAMLNGEVTLSNLTTGFVLGYLVLIAAHRALPQSSYTRKGWLFVEFVGFFLKELLLSNLIVAWDVITPRTQSSTPRIIAIPLDVKTEAGITALANFISLTPGTLTLDVSSDKKTLYVHAMFAEDEDKVRDHIKKQLEQKIIGLIEE